MNIEAGTRTLTSPAGRFFFSTDVILSHAKLVRDQITAATLGATTDASAGKPTPDSAVRWVRNNMNGPAKDTHFTWEPV